MILNFKGKTLSFVAALAVALAQTASAQTKPVAPQLNTLPNAKYSLFLDFSGINYSGNWGGTGRAPGNVPAFTLDGDDTTFNAAEVQTIKDTWARVAQSFEGFNINITTVDPAAGKSDADRIKFYDSKQHFMHTQLGGTYDWYAPSGGVSYVGVAQTTTNGAGYKTNWVFPVNGSGTSAQGMGTVVSHENGHGLKLPHQHDEKTGSEYSTNDYASGDGSYAPTMGAGYYSQRQTWRVGSASKGNVNDVSVLQSNADIGDLRDSGIGHSLVTATALAVNPNGQINSALAKGFILPKKETGYSAVGVDSYTKDYFKFKATGGNFTLTANNGTSYLKDGEADPGATMRAVLKIYDANGNLVATGAEDATTMKHSFTGSLLAGVYTAEISSYGAYTSSYEPDARYFNMGGYFLTGSGDIAAVPEPATMVALGLGMVGLLRRKKKSV